MGKKKGSKKGSKKKGSKGKTPDATSVAKAGPTQLELSLRLELQQLEKDLTIAKRETEEARCQNEFLHDEVRRTQEENAEYEAYIQKKTAKEKKMIEQLSDQNQRELDALETERTHLDLDSQRVKKELNDAIIVRDGELETTQRQIEDLHEVQKKRDRQEEEIAQLEANIEQHQREHFEALQRLKSKFLAEKKDFQQSANSKVQVLQAQAGQEAVTCLTKHSSQIKNENRRLRNKLLALMSNNKQLQGDENSLQEQNDELRRQIELNAELVRLVDTKQAMASASRF
jgi:chromosome segregation ATPase